MATKAAVRKEQLQFQPRARLLLLLGDQLIRDAGVAVFELVKNAYDADAASVSVLLDDVQSKDGRIVVEDDGVGMDWQTVTGVWLEPGTDTRQKQRERGERTPEFMRLPLGEKGVGRFAAHKLGSRIRLVTRRPRHREVVVDIDWDAFADARYLADARVEVRERTPRVFRGKHGTRIEIEGLRTSWSRRMVRELHRTVTAIRSPYSGPGDFHVQLEMEPDLGWFDDLLDVEDVLDLALFRAKGNIWRGEFKYEYDFRPPPGMDRVEPREHSDTVPLVLDNGPDSEGLDELANEEWVHIGPIDLDLYLFDRDSQVLALTVSDRKGLKEFLDSNGGIRVYRDGMRVYNYGEPENDWLELGGRRVNRPTMRISNNQTIGAVSLVLGESPGLIEKTNREGFIENDTYRVFRESVFAALKHIEAERNSDKGRIRRAYAGPKKEPVLDELGTLRRRVEESGLGAELGPSIDRIEAQFRDVRDRLMTAAGAGLSMAMVVHELEKGVGELSRALSRDVSQARVRELAKHLEELIEGLGYLTRRSGMSTEAASRMVRYALFNTEYRLDHHKIGMINALAEGDADFKVRCHRRLVVATLMNLIDNAIYWLAAKRSRKKLYIGTTDDLRGGPAIVVADNGPGFVDDPQTLIEPFVTRRPDGMGLGLHLAAEVMKVHRGRVDFPEPGDVDLPRGMNGAAVALVFPEGKWTG